MLPEECVVKRGGLAVALAVAIACAVVTNDMARQAGPAGANARMSVVERILLVAAAVSAGRMALSVG
jgi:hypothetical protein